MKCRGAVIAITGASSGLGHALALEMAERGAVAIGLMARRVDKLETVAAQVADRGAKPLAIATDVQDAASVNAAIEAIEAQLGPVDIVVANAGMGVPHKASEPSSELLHRTFAVNVFGVAHVVNAVIPGMLSRGKGQLVAVSSVAGYRGLPGNALYSSSKAAVSNLMEGYGLELAPQGLETTVIEPGFVRTEMTQKNTFKMPFILEADAAARLMADAIEAGKPKLVFPWQMSLMMGAMRLVPQSVFMRLGAMMIRSRDGWDKSAR